jgi:Holliday junction resolvase RusA-like endonuclease
MSALTFRAYGVPKGQPRVKAYVRGRHAGVYTPDAANGWKMEVRDAAMRAIQKDSTTITGPVGVALVFLMPRPKSHLRKDGTLKPSAPQHHTQKPDVDNLAKAVLDVLTDLRFWGDDAQVHYLMIAREWVENPHAAGCLIWLHW